MHQQTFQCISSTARRRIDCSAPSLREGNGFLLYWLIYWISRVHQVIYMYTSIQQISILYLLSKSWLINHEIIPFHKFNRYLEIKLSIDKKIYFLSSMFHMHYQNSLREETYLCSQSLVSIYSPGVITDRRVYFGQ